MERTRHLGDRKIKMGVTGRAIETQTNRMREGVRGAGRWEVDRKREGEREPGRERVRGNQEERG